MQKVRTDMRNNLNMYADNNIIGICMFRVLCNFEKKNIKIAHGIGFGNHFVLLKYHGYITIRYSGIDVNYSQLEHFFTRKFLHSVDSKGELGIITYGNMPLKH